MWPWQAGSSWWHRCSWCHTAGGRRQPLSLPPPLSCVWDWWEVALPPGPEGFPEEMSPLGGCQVEVLLQAGPPPCTGTPASPSVLPAFPEDWPAHQSLARFTGG